MLANLRAKSAPAQEFAKLANSRAKLTDSRAKLATQQSALMEALTTQTPLTGFDSERLQVTAVSLQQTRLRTLEHAHPCIVSALGDSFTELFTEYSEVHPIPAPGQTTDALQFMDYLAKCDLLPAHHWQGYFLSYGWKFQCNWWHLLRQFKLN